MHEELKTLDKLWKDIEVKMGIASLEAVKGHYYTLWRKIEDLLVSRDNWKAKYNNVKKEVKKKE